MKATSAIAVAAALLFAGCSRSQPHDYYDYGNYIGDWERVSGEGQLTIGADEWEWSIDEESHRIIRHGHEGFFECFDAFVEWKRPGNARLRCVGESRSNFATIRGKGRLDFNGTLWRKD